MFKPILFSLSEIYERVILSKLQSHISNKKRKKEFYFHYEYLDSTNLVNLMVKISVELNIKELMTMVFIDIDRVSQKRFLPELLKIKIALYTFKVIESFSSVGPSKFA